MKKNKKYEIFGKELKHNDLVIIFMFLGIMALVVGGGILYDSLTPNVPMNYTWDNIFKFSFIIVSIGLSFGLCSGVHPLLLFKSTKNVNINDRET